ncbi:hypothetical protein [Altererythrobacter fulvus]|uniref:hypothetical protein n=1 Tax=Caenibius fulvus TaxID=2126012 RepID=UPI0030175264
MAPDGIFDDLHEMLCVLRGGREILLAAAQIVTFPKRFIQTVEDVRLLIRYVLNESLQNAFMCQNPAFQFGVFDGHLKSSLARNRRAANGHG